MRAVVRIEIFTKMLVVPRVHNATTAVLRETQIFETSHTSWTTAQV